MVTLRIVRYANTTSPVKRGRYARPACCVAHCVYFYFIIPCYREYDDDDEMLSYTKRIHLYVNILWRYYYRHYENTLRSSLWKTQRAQRSVKKYNSDQVHTRTITIFEYAFVETSRSEIVEKINVTNHNVYKVAVLNWYTKYGCSVVITRTWIYM